MINSTNEIFTIVVKKESVKGKKKKGQMENKQF